MTRRISVLSTIVWLAVLGFIVGCGDDPPAPHLSLKDDKESADAERQRLRDLQKLRLTRTIGETSEPVVVDLTDPAQRFAEIGAPASAQCIVDLGMHTQTSPFCTSCKATTTQELITDEFQLTQFVGADVCGLMQMTCVVNKLLEITTVRSTPVVLQDSEDPEIGKLTAGAQTAATRAAVANYARELAADIQVYWSEFAKLATTPPTCVTNSNGLVNTLGFPSRPETRAELIGTGFVDTFNLYKEATDRFIANTLDVAEWQESTSPSQTVAGARSIAGEELSRSAAAHALVGGSDGLINLVQAYASPGLQLSAKTDTPLCITAEPAKGVRAAIQVFRQAAVSPDDILNKNLTIEDLLDSKDDCTNGTCLDCTSTPCVGKTDNGVPPNFSVRERLAEQWNQETELLQGTAGPHIEDYFGLSQEEFEIARGFLAEEIAVFGRSRKQKLQPRLIVGTRVTAAPLFAGTASEPPARPSSYFSSLAKFGWELTSLNQGRRNYAKFVDFSLTQAAQHLARQVNIPDTPPPMAAAKANLLDPLALLLSNGKAERPGRLVVVKMEDEAQDWKFWAGGFTAADQLRIVKGEDGLACALDGKIEGVPCTDLEPHTLAVLSGSLPPPSEVVSFDGFTTVVSGVRVLDPAEYLEANTRLYLVQPLSLQSEAIRHRVLSSFWVRSDFFYVHDAPIVPGADERAGKIMEPSRDWCAKPQASCAKLGADWRIDARIPLEDELSEDGDDVESSWKHYLALAKQAAEESDALGEEVLAAGVGVDSAQVAIEQRAEQALEELQDICGVAVDGARLREQLRNGGTTSFSSLRTTTPCSSNQQCLPLSDNPPPLTPTWDIPNYVCEGGFCTLDLVATVIQNSMFDENVGRLAECLASDSVRNFVTAGTKPVCVWEKANENNSMCADATIDTPCPVPANGGVCSGMATPGSNYLPLPTITETLGYFETGEDSPATESDVCDSIRRIRQGEFANEEERQLRVWALAASNKFHQNRMALLAGSVTFEARLGTHAAILVDRNPVFATGDQFADPEVSTGWPCAPSGRNCQGLTPSNALFCSVASCSDQHGRAEIVQRLMNAVATFRQSTELSPNLLDQPKLIIPYVINPLEPTGIEVQDRGSSWQTTNEERTGSLVPVTTQRGKARKYVGLSPHFWEGTTYKVQNPDAIQNLAWVFLDSNGLHVERRMEQGVKRFLLAPWAPGHQNEFFSDDDPPALDPLRAWYWSLSSDGDPNCKGFFHEALLNPSTTLPYDVCRLRATTVGDHIYAYMNVRGSSYAPEVLGLAPPTAASALDGLELACELSINGRHVFDPTVVPNISVEGWRAVKRYLHGVADHITRQSALMVFANFPTRAIDALRKTSRTGSYPAVGGRYGIALSELRGALLEVSEVSPLIASQLRGAGDDLELLETSQALAEVSQEIAEVQYDASIANHIAGCMGSMSLSLSLAPLAQCANAIAQIGFAGKLKSLSAEQAELSSNVALINFRESFSTRATTLQSLASRANKAAEIIDAKLGELEVLREQGKRALTKALWDDSEVGKLQGRLHSAAQQRYNTANVRYEKSRRNAIAMAFLAKRAIETRLGLRMSEMTEELPLVPAPQTWESSICMTSGLNPINYEEIANSDGTKNYADAYLGDYVNKLEKVVESYRIAHNFHEGKDTAVVSLRDDLLGVRAECDVPVDNLLYNAGTLTLEDIIPYDPVPLENLFTAHEGKWIRTLCGVDQTMQEPLPNCVTALALPDVERPFDPRVPELSAARGYRVAWGPMDGSTCDPQTCGLRDTSGISQYLKLSAGRYRLSWYGRLVPGKTNPDHPGSAVVLLKFKNGFAEFPDESLEGTPETANGDWERYSWTFRIAEDAGAIVLVPRYSGSSEIDLTGVMLEADVKDGPVEPPKDFANTSDTLTQSLKVCEDTDGSNFRLERWQRRCVKLCADGFSSDCSEQSAQTYCYRETSVTFNQRDINAGRIFNTSGFALGNFNYRIESVGLNFVGTGIRDCTGSPTPSTCYGAGYATYSVQHAGPYHVRNHAGDDVEVQLFTANVEHARGLAAERYLTNPLSSADRSLVEPYLRKEFNGRPLDGTFVIRVWEEPGFNFEAIQDVQLLLNYRYWTGFE